MPIEKHKAIVLTDQIFVPDSLVEGQELWTPITDPHLFANKGEMHTMMYANTTLFFPPGAIRSAIVDTRMMRINAQDSTAGNTRTYPVDMHNNSVKITDTWETYAWPAGESYEWQMNLRGATGIIKVRYAKGWVRYE